MPRERARPASAARGSRPRGIDSTPKRTRKRRAAAVQSAPRRLPLGSLRVFVCVAEHLSFTRAGEALGVTPGAASLQIRALEEYLTRQLFRRNGRVVELTTEGAELLPRVQQALADIERALAATRGDRSGGPLRVTMLASFLQSWLLPRLPRLRAEQPRLDLQVHTSELMLDLVRDGQHAAIRLGTGDWPGVTAEKLLEEWLVPVCTPELYAKHGPLRRREDIARYPLVHSTSEPWTAWLLGKQAMEDTTSPFTGTRVDDSAAVVRLALQGLGLALARWSLAGDEVVAGRLVTASNEPVSFFRTYWLLQPKQGRAHPAFAQFREWLRAEMAKFPRPPGT
jgi:LysR family glycine cleavage system transcriptional activator